MPNFVSIISDSFYNVVKYNGNMALIQIYSSSLTIIST